jgi:hypothetical protein
VWYAYLAVMLKACGIDINPLKHGRLLHIPSALLVKKSLQFANRLYILEMQCVSCDLGTEFWNSILFKTLMLEDYYCWDMM